MDIRSLFQFNAVVALLYGIMLLVLPVQFVSMYGVALDGGGAAITQLFGAALIGFGLITWFARDAEPGVARHAICQALCWTDGIGAVVASVATARGMFNAMGWTTVGVYLLLFAAYAYVLYVKNEGRQPAT